MAKGKASIKNIAPQATPVVAAPRRGFPGFAKPTKVDPQYLADRIERLRGDNTFVLFTGGTYKARKSSGRSTSLQTITEKGVPLPLTVLVSRAARCMSDGSGFPPDLVRSGLFLHRGSNPSVYIALEKDSEGNYKAATDYPFADPSYFNGKALRRGDVVISAKEAKKLEPQAAAIIAAEAKKGANGKALKKGK